MPVNPTGSVHGPGQLVTSGQTQVLDFPINCLPPSGLGHCYDWPRHVAMHVKQRSRSAGLSPVDTAREGLNKGLRVDTSIETAVVGASEGVPGSRYWCGSASLTTSDR